MMRNDPAEDAIERPWAVTSGILFGQLRRPRRAGRQRPASLANAVNKTYFQHFPEEVRPRTLISRDRRDHRRSSRRWEAARCSSRCRARAAAACSWCRSNESPNLNQMIEALSRDGYIVAQDSCRGRRRATSGCSS